jgi:ATP-dependent protease HslVU (ClpYQ) peptidase subunit
MSCAVSARDLKGFGSFASATSAATVSANGDEIRAKVNAFAEAISSGGGAASAAAQALVEVNSDDEASELFAQSAATAVVEGSGDAIAVAEALGAAYNKGGCDAVSKVYTSKCP